MSDLSDLKAELANLNLGSLGAEAIAEDIRAGKYR